MCLSVCTDGLLCNTAQVSLTVNLLPTRLVWSDKLPWLLSGDSLKSRSWNTTLAERSEAKQNKPGFVLSLADGTPPLGPNAQFSFYADDTVIYCCGATLP